MKHFAIYLLICILLSNCESPGFETGPKPFAAFIYTKEGDNYLDQHQDDSIAVYHLRDGEKVYSTIRIETFRDSTILNVINDFQHDSSLEDYYLQVGSDIDTLLIKEKRFEYKEVRFNGKPVEWRYDPEIHFYIVKKQ